MDLLSAIIIDRFSGILVVQILKESDYHLEGIIPVSSGFNSFITNFI